ncbi:hypothetical protein [Streptomyces tanashiensis]|uniref:hypothetical protein n=1 Tax=Streptomyces tanashiensis TaxID=67367 RepID=UPI0034199311
MTTKGNARGCGTLMMLRAMRDCESYTWTTTPQFEDGPRFFAALSAATGISFLVSGACGHNVAGGSGFAALLLDGLPGAPWPTRAARGRFSCA